MNFSPYGLTLERGSAQPVNSILMHSHEYHELFFLLSGQRKYFVGHTIYNVAPGDLVIIPQTQLHRTAEPSPHGYTRYLLNFYQADHPALTNLIGREDFRRLMHMGCIQFPAHIAQQVQRDLERLEQELNAPSSYAKAISAHLLQDILMAALCYGKTKDPFHGESADKVQEVAQHISRSYTQPLSLSQAARMAFMEETYFSKRFKTLTGFGFHEYLIQTRLRAAEQLLRETRLNLNDIAEQSGFSGANHFGNVFRRWKGVSPSQYRKAYLESKEKTPVIV